MTREMNTQSANKAANSLALNLSKTMGAQPLVKAANSVATTAANAANSVATTAANAASSVATTATNAANAVAKTANSLANSIVSPTAPLNSSLTRMGNNLDKLNTSIQNKFNSVGDTIRENTAKAMNSAANLGGLNSKNSNLSLLFGNGPNANIGKNNSNVNMNVGNVADAGIASLGVAIGIFFALLLTFILLFYYFASEIKDGYDKLGRAIRTSLGMDSTPPTPPKEPVPDSLVPPPTGEGEISPEVSQNILEKVLPLGRNPEVFNVSKNEFTYYDAEPLCRALGAELATYEQVKEAYDKGADWCNYGWVKGQVAIYPTQKATWDTLQNGPEDQKEACGRPGVNGGFFDNPEMRFGVNCYGPKPPQSAHDEAELAKQGRIPRTTASLKVDEKINEYKRMADSLGVLPFSKEKWGTA